MTSNPVTTTVSVGLKNLEVTQSLRGQLSSYRLGNNLEYPIQVLEGAVAPRNEGFISVKNMMHKSLQHAAIVRRTGHAVLGLGMALGPLYVPRSEVKQGPYLFDTLLLTVVDAYGPVAWCWPSATYPTELERLLRSVCAKHFETRRGLRRTHATDFHMDLASIFVQSFLEDIRPLPTNLGITRKYC